MPFVELEAGPLAYEDTGGDGPVVVLCHGVPMDHRVWRKVVPLLPGMRIIAPTLPLGGHRLPMRPGADLSQRGVAGILGDFLDALDLDDVTLVLNDWGGGQFLINDGRTDRIGGLVLVACEAFDNFPPGPAKIMNIAGRIPGGFSLLLRLMGLRVFRQMKRGYGGMSVLGLPDELIIDWFRPAMADRRIRRDFIAFATGNPSRAELLRLSQQWRSFTKPVLIVWAAEDRLMPAVHGPRLEALYPDSRLEVIEDAATLVAEDRPELLAELIADFAQRER